MNNIRFADDSVLVASSMEKLQMLVSELALVCSEMNLKMSHDKIKNMTNKLSAEEKMCGRSQLESWRYTEYDNISQLVNMERDLWTEIFQLIKLG